MQTQGKPLICQKNEHGSFGMNNTNSQAKVYGEFNLHKPRIIMVSESWYGA
jgi:hypothetical protein